MRMAVFSTMPYSSDLPRAIKLCMTFKQARENNVARVLNAALQFVVSGAARIAVLGRDNLQLGQSPQPD